ncbi:hypothetical protein RO3G_02210 [Rhizopus delemar RA 99-880]|uniref:Uncharacterized protein n=1 Tax=Rhizopus delemar (strain RA 99-880 / ATCC MYA-4621 / FGSC 9543 / NRRL 43880) TaxID=246409 RepID=I1BMS6_RHIO9|nr:hypothetical protein RO3G_02210 [Rhizopus delemar RA 99-880]|eukprot:EIE77506.1 hypothetical protein RO3G_02210 [Rhizopus delemar RA 99-880]
MANCLYAYNTSSSPSRKGENTMNVLASYELTWYSHLQALIFIAKFLKPVMSH